MRGESLIMNQSDITLTRVEARMPVLPSSLGIEDMSYRAYALIKNVADYPAYMPSVKSIEIITENGNEMVTRWNTEIDGAPLNWIQNIQSDDIRRELVFTSTEGDFDVFQGRWFITESNGRIFLNLLIEYKLGIPIIEEVLGPILKEKIKTNSDMMLKAIADRLSAMAGPRGDHGQR